MNFRSFRHFGVSPWRLGTIGLVLGSSTALAMDVVAGEILGSARVEIEGVIGVLVTYIVVTTPKRALKFSAYTQSREAASMAVAGAAGFEATGSRAKTLVLLRPEDPDLRRALREANRRILLGHSPARAAHSGAGILSSYSAANVLESIGTLRPQSIQERGEEVRGIENSDDLSEESKMPIFITVCFFAPILLILLAAFSHLATSGKMVELLVFQVVLVDLAFFLCSGERRV